MVFLLNSAAQFAPIIFSASLASALNLFSSALIIFLKASNSACTVAASETFSHCLGSLYLNWLKYSGLFTFGLIRCAIFNLDLLSLKIVAKPVYAERLKEPRRE